jgi:hypothetical protein
MLDMQLSILDMYDIPARQVSVTYLPHQVSVMPRQVSGARQSRPTIVVLIQQEFALIACERLYSLITKRDAAVAA